MCHVHGHSGGIPRCPGHVGDDGGDREEGDADVDDTGRGWALASGRPS